MAIVECVPNVSEGRRGDAIDRMADAIRAVGGVRLLDRTSDADHNRSVFTFAGPPDAVEAAAHALVDVAVREIDLRTHSGEHPRIGAVDVVPFVPLAGATMDECVAISRRFGAAVAERHGLPVYFYARSATRPDRVRLPDIRRPQFEGLAAVIETTHVPDAGPSRVHPTGGALVTGARPPLIAFNIELDTADVTVAKRIAKAIRESSGGLPAVQALGFELTDPPRAQVSMNLLDTSVTSLARAWHEVERRAADVGVRILRGELIGLMPLDAAVQVTADALQLEGLTRDRIVEAHFVE